MKDRATKEPKLNLRNWECGVVVPIPAKESPIEPTGGSPPQGQQLGMEVFHGSVPVPMAVPGEAYGPRRPWFYSER